jgi:hypothetical protein
MTSDDLVIDMFRSAGAMLQRGIPVRAPTLPRFAHSRALLEREARRDPRVRKAYEAAVAKDEKARQLRPQVLMRACGEILQVR